MALAKFTLVGLMMFWRTSYKGYTFHAYSDCVGRQFIRIVTPFGEPCGYAVTPRAAVLVVARVELVRHETGYPPPFTVLYNAGVFAGMYRNPEKRT